MPLSPTPLKNVAFSLIINGDDFDTMSTSLDDILAQVGAAQGVTWHIVSADEVLKVESETETEWTITFRWYHWPGTAARNGRLI